MSGKRRSKRQRLRDKRRKNQRARESASRQAERDRERGSRSLDAMRAAQYVTSACCSGWAGMTHAERVEAWRVGLDQFQESEGVRLRGAAEWFADRGFRYAVKALLLSDDAPSCQAADPAESEQ